VTGRGRIVAAMEKRNRSSWLVPAGLVFLAVVPTLAGAARLVGLARGHSVVPGHERFAADPIATVLHVIGATGFLLGGALQFSGALRRRHPRWHRVLGRVLIPLALVAALTGLWMTLTWPAAEYAGPALAAVRLVVGSAMTTFIVMSILALSRRDYVAHGAFMTRAYALGSGAGTQVLTHLPWLLCASIRSEAVNTVLMALGWIINMVLAEVLLRRGARRRAAAPAPLAVARA
jgi:hypothetical protein